MRKFIILCLILRGAFGLQAQCLDGNCKNGHGTAFFKKNGVKYTGDFQNKRPHGKGIAEYPNGRRYEGNWYNGMWHGQGTMVMTDGNTLTGLWENSRFKSLAKFPPNEMVQIESEQQNTAKQSQVKNSGLGTQVETYSKPNALANTEIPAIWALAVGVSAYDNPTIPPLKYPDNDAWSIFSFWKSPSGGALDDDHAQILVDDAATKALVTTGMKNIYAKAKSEDLAIFFFSGHGLKGSFLPSDYDGDDIRIYHAEINRILAGCPAKHKLVIADACHSGSYIASKSASSRPKKETAEQFYEELSKVNPGTAYLLSSLADEESLEVSSLHNSVFTYFLVRGLKGEANQNSDNIITIKELFDFVYLNVTSFAASLGKIQTPVLKGDFDPNTPVAVIK